MHWMRGRLKGKCGTEGWIRHGEFVVMEEQRREGEKESRMTTGESTHGLTVSVFV